MLGILYLLPIVESVCSALESFGGGHDKLKVIWHFSISKDYQQIQIIFWSSYEYHIHCQSEDSIQVIKLIYMSPPIRMFMLV